MPHAHLDGQTMPIGGRKFAPLDHRKQALRLRSPASVLTCFQITRLLLQLTEESQPWKIAIQRSVFGRYDRELL
jgi:hypothetical protein